MSYLPDDIIKLDEKINLIKNAQQDEVQQNTTTSYSQYNKVIIIIIEFFSSIAIGLCLGMFLDKLFASQLVCTIIFLIIGILSGALNVYRYIKKEFLEG